MILKAKSILCEFFRVQDSSRSQLQFPLKLLPVAKDQNYFYDNSEYALLIFADSFYIHIHSD